MEFYHQPHYLRFSTIRNCMFVQHKTRVLIDFSLFQIVFIRSGGDIYNCFFQNTLDITITEIFNNVYTFKNT